MPIITQITSNETTKMIPVEFKEFDNNTDLINQIIGNHNNIKASGSNNQTVLTETKFHQLYGQSNYTKKEIAGTLIFNEGLSEILLVKGRLANKWGPPKGHRECSESNIETAIRETFEEIGYEIKLKSKILPCIIISKTKLYCLIVPESTIFKTYDSREIIGIQWFNIKSLEKEIKISSNNYNGCTRGLFKKPMTMKLAINKVNCYKINYQKNCKEIINGQLEEIINKLHNIHAYNQNNKEIFHYICFTAIQKIYNNIFTNNELIEFIKTQLN